MQSCRCLQGPRDENQEILSTPSNTESSISLLSSSTKKKKNSDGNWKKVYFSKLIWWSLQSLYKWIVKKRVFDTRKRAFRKNILTLSSKSDLLKCYVCTQGCSCLQHRTLMINPRRGAPLDGKSSSRNPRNDARIFCLWLLKWKQSPQAQVNWKHFLYSLCLTDIKNRLELFKIDFLKI